MTFKVKGDETILEHKLSFYADVNVKEHQISCTTANISVTIAKSAPSSWPYLWHQDQLKVPMAEQPPRYPSSSKKKVDWDRLASDAAAEEAARAKEQQSVDDFFKQIYQNASEESRRAMNKSFVRNITLFSHSIDHSLSLKELYLALIGVKSVQSRLPQRRHNISILTTCSALFKK